MLNYLQISAGRGPLECQRAVWHFAKMAQSEWRELGFKSQVLDISHTGKKGTLQSALFEIDVPVRLGDAWQAYLKENLASHLWICSSPFRANYKRKNWFFQVNLVKAQSLHELDDALVKVQTCRASGAGGQHVNTTDSAVRLTYAPLNLSIRCESQRSQKENLRVGRILLAQAVAEHNEHEFAKGKNQSWRQHDSLQRGDAKRVFLGLKFKEK